MSRRTAVVTGAASGIGRALSIELASSGYHVRAVDIDEAGVEGLASEVGAASSALDVSDAQAILNLAADTGAVDLLCLNAGVVGSSMGPPWEADQEEWDTVLGVNLHGVVNGLRAFVPLLLERQEPSHILITASLAGALTWPTGGAYAASKHAVLAVAEQAAIHLADSQVSVTVLCPALVRTAMSTEGEDPQDLATMALDAVATGRFSVVPPEWTTALQERADMLASGSNPQLPSPGS